MVNKKIYIKRIFLKKLKTSFYNFNVKQRNLKIKKNLVGLTLNIYNGNKYIPLEITELMLGHTLGEFSFTRLVGYKNKNK